MKSLIALTLTSLVSMSAMATQTITCTEVTKKNTPLKGGFSLVLDLESKEATLSGRRVLQGGILKDLEVTSADQGVGAESAKRKFTTVYLDTAGGDGMLDIQLQFQAHIKGKNFSQVPAQFVIGSDSANPEAYFAYGYDMLCESVVSK